MFCGAFPEQGLGIAIKCDDGAGRAGEAITAATIVRFLEMETADRLLCERYVRPTLRNWNGIEVGQLRPTAALDVPSLP